MSGKPLLKHGCNVVRMGVALYVFICQHFELFHLTYERRHNDKDDTCDDGYYKDKGKNDAYSARCYMHLILYKLYYGIKQISQKPSNEKGQKHFREGFKRKKHSCKNQCNDRPA